MEASPKTNATEEQKPVGQTEFSEKPIDMHSLTQQQRILLRSVQHEFQGHDLFKALSAQPRVIFYDWINMISTPGGLEMLDIEGVEFWKSVEVVGTKKKEKQRFVKFSYNYVIPGTMSKLNMVKEWKYEDFTP